MFCSLIISTPQTTQPNTIYKIYKAIIPVGTILAIASGIATTCCYYKEHELIEELAKFNEQSEKITNATIELSPEEAQAFREMMEQKIAQYTKGKWICCSITIASIITAAVGGIQAYKLAKIKAKQERIEAQKQNQLRLKTNSGNSLKDKIKNEKNLVNNIKQDKTQLANLQNQIDTKLGTLYKLHKCILEEQDYYKKITINGEIPDEISKMNETIIEYKQFNQEVDNLLAEIKKKKEI